MEVINVTPEKFLKIITRVGVVLASLILVWRIPDVVIAIITK